VTSVKEIRISLHIVNHALKLDTKRLVYVTPKIKKKRISSLQDKARVVTFHMYGKTFFVFHLGSNIFNVSGTQFCLFCYRNAF